VEAAGLGLDERVGRALRRLGVEPDAAVAVMVVEEVRERAPTDAELRVAAVALALRLGQRGADRPQAGEARVLGLGGVDGASIARRAAGVSARPVPPRAPGAPPSRGRSGRG
jgi:hypothetical protein